MKRHAGATMIEVLVAILVLSFGMLALGGMLAFAVQAPKLAGYRAIAANLASSHVEKMRANPTGFSDGEYVKALTYDGSFNSLSVTGCTYPDCTVSSLATMDHGETAKAIRTLLPAGGLLVSCDPSPCSTNSYGNLWVIWQEPASVADINAANSDNCPASVSSFSPRPRCLYVRFKP